MRLRPHVSRWFSAFTIAAAALSTASLSSSPANAPAGETQNKKPSISLRANPPVGFSPLRVVVTAEIKGGANDYEEFYCPAVEWDWDDDTKSESKTDCEPYEPGKTEIKRRYVMDHTFRAYSIDPTQPQGPSQFRVKFTLKQKNKTVGSGQTTVEIRSGAGGQ
jgi:hypothetical protein